MTLSDVRATIGLNGIATLAAPQTAGNLRLGPANQILRLREVTQGYSMLAVFAGSADNLVLDLLTASTTGSTAWVPGSAQEDMATAVGTISTAGTASVTVTSAGMAGSPLVVPFSVALGDTPTVWAAKARAALAANATIAARFTPTGTGTGIGLRRKPLATFATPTGELPIYAASDGTLNLALADVTSAGITEASTSATTTAGAASGGVAIFDAGSNLDGDALTMTQLQGIELILTGATDMAMNGSGIERNELAGGEVYARAIASGALAMDTTVTFIAAGPSALSVTAFGQFVPDP